MPEKDFYEKKLEDFNDVFADILNVFLFSGNNTVQPDELETGMGRSAYKTRWWDWKTRLQARILT